MMRSIRLFNANTLFKVSLVMIVMVAAIYVIGFLVGSAAGKSDRENTDDSTAVAEENDDIAYSALNTVCCVIGFAGALLINGNAINLYYKVDGSKYARTIKHGAEKFGKSLAGSVIISSVTAVAVSLVLGIFTLMGGELELTDLPPMILFSLGASLLSCILIRPLVSAKKAKRKKRSSSDSVACRYVYSVINSNSGEPYKLQCRTYYEYYINSGRGDRSSCFNSIRLPLHQEKLAVLRRVYEDMKSFLLSLRFVIKRVFRLTAVNIVWLICFAAVIVAVTVGMAVAPEIRGSEDYPFYLTTVPFITVLLFFGVSSLYSDIYVSVYIRTSRLYKCLRTRAVQVFLLMMSVVALTPAIIVTAVVNPSALPDFLLVSAIIIGVSLPLASTYFLMWIVFFGYSIFNLIAGFFGEHFMVEGFKFLPTELTDSLPVAALLAVVILLAGLIVSFIISDIIFRIRKRPRDRQMLKGTMQA